MQNQPIWQRQLSLDASKKGIFITEASHLITDVSNQPVCMIGKTIETLALEPMNVIYFGGHTFIKCRHLKTDAHQLQLQGYQMVPIRTYMAHSEGRHQKMLLMAHQWLKWDEVTQYCGQCGGLLKAKIDVAEKVCLPCDRTIYPQLAPAMMVLITNGDKILLARSPHFPAGMYSSLAGFTQLGETAEDAVHREVDEEVGLRVTNLTYFSSQTWPFPGSFMLAYMADYHSGQIRCSEEIEDAQWFDIKQLPQIPIHASIARQLIDSAVEKKMIK